MYTRSLGDGESAPTEVAPAKPPSLRDAIDSEPVSTAAAIALTYHGYRRTGSLFWALVYGALGRWKPAIAVPISIAQGYGQRKPCP
jgi:hypothetical protein